MRIAATALAPFVLIADLANSRRAAWGILIIGSLVLLICARLGMPERRKVVTVAMLGVAIASAVYFPLYWNHGYGTVAQPARAVRSQISPNSRDTSSDAYRKAENANLIFNIKESGLLGKGFGRPIDYVIAIPNISNYDPTIGYIPHNGLLWIWMRLGLQGEIVLWLLMAYAILTAANLTRGGDRFLALFGSVAVCAVIGYVFQGYEDQGLASLRIAIVMGCFFGALEAAHRIALQGQTPSATSLRAASARARAAR
jgi:hypothetical protein